MFKQKKKSVEKTVEFHIWGRFPHEYSHEGIILSMKEKSLFTICKYL